MYSAFLAIYVIFKGSSLLHTISDHRECGKTKTLRIDRIRYDIDVFGLIYKLLAPVAAKAADMRALGTAPEDAHIEPIDPHDVKELREELEDTMKTHVERIM